MKASEPSENMNGYGGEESDRGDREDNTEEESLFWADVDVKDDMTDLSEVFRGMEIGLSSLKIVSPNSHSVRDGGLFV